MIFGKKYILTLYIFCLIILYYIFIKLNLHQFPSKYVFTDLLINYEGGFARRGLIGQIIIEINSLGINFNRIIFFIQFLPYLIYLILIFHNFSQIKKNIFWYLILFSPLFLFYPLGELESLGRKDIYLILLYLIYLNLNIKNKFQIDFILIFLLSSLIHEITFFFIGYYFFAIFLLKKNNLNSLSVIYLFIFLLILAFINLAFGSSANIYEMTKPFKYLNINEASGAFSWVNKPLIDQIFLVISRLNFKVCIIYITYFLFTALPFILLYLKNKNLKVIIYSFLPFLILLPIFVLALDWGRFLYLNYNFLIITFLFLSKKNYLANCNFCIINNKKIRIIFLFLYCFCLSPKITLNDSIGSLPQYRTIIKISK